MPTVPYQGVQQVAPQLDPIPRYSVDATPAAFGVNVAQAVEGLGKTAEGAGNEIFTRGLAMQDLNNHAEAQEATANFMKQAGDIYAKLDSMQGKDAVDYYANGFQKDLDAARNNIKGSLSNSMSQQMFNSEALGTIGRITMNGARVAGAANKQYAISSNESQTQQQTDIAATSNNPSDVAAAREKIKGLAQEHSALKGYDPNTAEEYAKTINSSLDFNVIQQMARTNPIAAGDELEKRRDSMTAKDYDRARTVVDNTNRAVGSVNIAQTIIGNHVGDDGKPDASFETMENEATAMAKAQAPGDALMVKHTTDALKGLYNQKIYADKQFKWENSQTIDAAIQNGVTDIQQLRADPQVATAIDNLPKSEQLKIPARINAYNSARDRVANQAAMTTLSGLRNNNVEAFLNTNAADPQFKLSQPQIREVQAWQQQDKKKQNEDPRVNRALDWLRQARGGELQALGVFHRTTSNTDDYDHMTGTLQSALDLWQQAHGKPAEYKDVIDTIGPQIIQSRSVAGAWWGTNQEPFFKPDVNSADYKAQSSQMTKDAADRGGSVPTTEQIDRAYTQTQLLKLYPPKSKTTNGK